MDQSSYDTLKRYADTLPEPDRSVFLHDLKMFTGFEEKRIMRAMKQLQVTR